MTYRIELGENSLTYRKSQVHEFHRELFYSHESDGCRYFVGDKQVSQAEAIAACEAAFASAVAKKEQTHKRIRVSIGASNLDNTFVSKWVRK